MNDLLIWFNELSKDCQDRMLSCFNVDSPEEMNWDIIPITFVDSAQYQDQEEVKRLRSES